MVPLRMGSGTRLKVLEGMAMGRPLVSTSLGCEGIATVDGEHLLVADDPASFARGVLRILDDPVLAANLGRNGRALVQMRYSWPSVLQQLEEFMMRARRSSAARCGQPGAPRAGRHATRISPLAS